MSEEVQDVTEETAAPAEASAPEEKTAEAAAPQESKKKKINKLTLAELNKKIAEIEETNFTFSIYYKHLKQRQKELQPAE